MRKIAGMLALAAALAALPLPVGAGAVTSLQGMTSTIFMENQSSFAGLAFRLEVHPPALIPQVALMPNIEYWRNSSSLKSFDIASTRKDANLGLDAAYQFATGNWHPYVGAGAALHFLSARVNAPSLGLDDASESAVKGGLALLGGVTFELAGKISNVIELKYHYVPDQSQLKFNWGIGYQF